VKKAMGKKGFENLVDQQRFLEHLLVCGVMVDPLV